MNDKELMQQVLEALTAYDGTNNASQRKRVLAALRERLAQPEREPFCFHDGRNIVGKEYADHSDVFPLYTSPNPEQQKPVRFNCTVIDDAHLNGVPLSQWGKQHEMQPCAGRNCGSTNPNLHSAECFEDYEKSTGMSSVEHAVIAGALFDFMGWLTSRKERLVLSSADEASPAVDAIRDFAKMRGLSLDDAKVQDWNTSPPAQRTWVGLTDEEIAELRRNGAHSVSDKDFRAIEAKLKEKNT